MCAASPMSPSQPPWTQGAHPELSSGAGSPAEEVVGGVVEVDGEVAAAAERNRRGLAIAQRGEREVALRRHEDRDREAAVDVREADDHAVAARPEWSDAGRRRSRPDGDAGIFSSGRRWATEPLVEAEAAVPQEAPTDGGERAVGGEHAARSRERRPHGVNSSSVRRPTSTERHRTPKRMRMSSYSDARSSSRRVSSAREAEKMASPRGVYGWKRSCAVLGVDHPAAQRHRDRSQRILDPGEPKRLPTPLREGEVDGPPAGHGRRRAGRTGPPSPRRGSPAGRTGSPAAGQRVRPRRSSGPGPSRCPAASRSRRRALAAREPLFPVTAGPVTTVPFGGSSRWSAVLEVSVDARVRAARAPSTGPAPESWFNLASGAGTNV